MKRQNFDFLQKNIDKTELSRLIDEYDALNENQKGEVDAIDPDAYNEAVDEKFSTTSTPESVKTKTEKLKNALEKWKNPTSDVSEAKNLAKAELQKLIDLAKLAETKE